MADRRPNIPSFSIADSSTSIPARAAGPSPALARTSSASGSGSSSSVLDTNSNSASNSNAAATPPATDCFACKKRRIACDRGMPTCQKCAKKGLTCPGYKKPKIVWKVLKINQIVDARKFPGVKNEVGETQASRSTGASVLPTRRRTQATIRKAKTPLIDIGYTFKVEQPDQEPTVSESLRRSSPSDDEDIETIPRNTDPYFSHVDHFSRDTLNYYYARICMCIEYFKPLRPGANGLLAPSARNPLGVLMAEGFSSPLLLNCMLSIAARHRVIIINTEAYTGMQREYDAGKFFTSALTYHGRAVQLLRERVTEQNYFENPTAGRICEDTTMGGTEGKVSIPARQLWEDDSIMMVIMLLIYYDMIDGGGDGDWRKHLEIGKWVIEQREARGLGMGMPGADWGFIREHLETFEAIGSSFTPAWRMPSQEVWLRPRPGEPPLYDSRASSPTTPPSTPDQLSSYPPMHPPRSIDDIMNAPDYVPDYPMLLIPRGLWRCMHQIASLRREYAFLQNPNKDASMTIQEICNAHEHILACISAFNPSSWPSPPVPQTASPTEFLALGALYQLSLHVYLHLSVTLPLSKSLAAASYGITVTAPPLTPRTSPSPEPSGSEYGSPPPPNRYPAFSNPTAELLGTLSSNIATHLRLIPGMSPAFRSTVWPCMCAGIAAQTIEQVMFIRRYMRILAGAMPCQGVTRGYESLERLWAKRAKAGREKRARRGLSALRMGPPEGLMEGEWDENLEGYEGVVEEWELVVGGFEGDWLVI